MQKHQYVILSIIIVSILIPIVLIIQILKYKNSQLESINTIMLQEAQSHFEDAVITRQWNAQYGGVFVRENNSIQPNPYLKDNHIFDEHGQMLVKINPAWMTRQISELSNLHRDYYFKITSLKPLNPNNKADKFEQKGLKLFEKNKEITEYYEVDNEKNYFNYIGALTVQKECLECHATQNYKVGDIRGGIRVSIPIKSHNAKVNTIELNAYLSIATVLISAIIIAILLIRFIMIISNKTQQYENLNQQLEDKIKQELEKSRNKDKMLAQQSKLASMGEMLNNIAHQWRQPLSTITTATSGMQVEKEMGILDDKEFEKNTKIIIDQANYMSKTIDDFKGFFKTDKIQVRFNLKDIILKDIEMLKSSYSGNNITINITDIGDHISLFGYANELSQALLNILNNAKDQLIQLDNQDKQIILSTTFNNNNVELFIQDNAGGIPANIIDKVFEPYFTTKHQSQGTGIGLYMTQQIIVDHMEGSIEAYNQEVVLNDVSYQGACFKITLPIASELE